MSGNKYAPAPATFSDKKAEIEAKLQRLQELAAQNFGVKGTPNWANVGDLCHYLELLTRITDAAFQEGEHARVGA